MYYIHSKFFFEFLNKIYTFVPLCMSCKTPRTKSSYQAIMNSFPITSIKRNWFLEFLNKNIHFCTTVHCHMPCKEQVHMSQRFQVIISYRINLIQTTFILKTLFLEFLNKNLTFRTTVHARMP